MQGRPQVLHSPIDTVGLWHALRTGQEVANATAPTSCARIMCACFLCPKKTGCVGCTACHRLRAQLCSVCPSAQMHVACMHDGAMHARSTIAGQSSMLTMDDLHIVADILPEASHAQSEALILADLHENHSGAKASWSHGTNAPTDCGAGRTRFRCLDALTCGNATAKAKVPDFTYRPIHGIDHTGALVSEYFCASPLACCPVCGHA